MAQTKQQRRAIRRAKSHDAFAAADHVITLDDSGTWCRCGWVQRWWHDDRASTEHLLGFWVDDKPPMYSQNDLLGWPDDDPKALVSWQPVR